MPTFSLSFEDNGTFHGDLVLQLDQFERRSDSFYLADDNDLLPERRDSDKVRLVLIQLLRQWADAVKALAPGDCAFLPYEFDDQCSAWLQLLSPTPDMVEILPVWSKLEAWAFNPSAYASALSRLGVTTPAWDDLRPQRMARSDVLDKIALSIAEAQSSINT